MPHYVSPKEPTEMLGVSEKTLRNWEAAGKIGAIRTPSNHRRYDVESYLKRLGKDNRAIIKDERVSSYKQREDLNRQESFLLEKYPQAISIKEIGGGLNFKRQKLLTLLGRVLQGDVKQVVVTHSDRPARFGVELIRWFCEQYDCQLVVLNRTDLSPERELVEDILAIIHVFSCRIYGLRKYKTQIKEDQDLP